jgi:apolipoprotein N-acyltransferase
MRQPLVYLVAALAVSAILYIGAFPPYAVPEGAFVFAVPLLLYGALSRPAAGERRLLFLGGWIIWIILLAWLRNAAHVLDVPLKGVLGWGMTAALAGVVALFWWLWTVFAVRLMRSCHRMGRPAPLPERLAVLFGLAGLWVVLEWLRSVVFSGFPWLLLGVSQWQRPLMLQVAAWTGGWGIAFLLIVFNLGLSFYLLRIWSLRKARWWQRFCVEFYVALAVLFAAIGLGLYGSGNAAARERGEEVGFGIVQPDVDVPLKWDPDKVRENLDDLERLTLLSALLQPQVILWPEATTALPISGHEGMERWAFAMSREAGVPILAGSLVRLEERGVADSGLANGVVIIDPQQGVLAQHYAKRRLVPFGEFVPLARFMPFLRTFVPVGSDIRAGKQATLLDLTIAGGETWRVGSLLCYEDIFPALARANALAGADFHYVATNNVWFGEAAGAYQHAAHSVLRAVETRRPVLRCGNAGWSGWIDEFGHIRHTMRDQRNSIYFQGTERMDVSLSQYWSNRQSFYTRYGDWFVALCVLLLIPLSLAWWRQRPDH